MQAGRDDENEPADRDSASVVPGEDSRSVVPGEDSRSVVPGEDEPGARPGLADLGLAGAAPPGEAPQGTGTPGGSWAPTSMSSPAPPADQAPPADPTVPADPAGQSGYAQPGYAQGYAPSGYETPRFGPPSYGPPPGGQPGSGQPGYSQQPLPGQPGYPPPSPGQPGYAAPGFGPGDQQGAPTASWQPPSGVPQTWPGQGQWTPPPGGPGYGGQPQPGGPQAWPPLPAQAAAGQGQWAPPPGYGAPGYGPPGYGQPGYGQPGYGQPPGSQPPPSRGPMGRALIYLLVAVLAGAVGAGAVLALRGGPGAAPSVSSHDIPKPAPNAAGNGNAGNPNLSQSVARKVEPGMVDIISRLHFSQQVFEGTGMVLSPNGLVLTNNHVIKGSTSVRVRLVGTGRTYQATIVGTDNTDDVALLQLTGASGLKTVKVGDSAKLTLHTPVVALGNAGGTGGTPTVTQGYITALNKTIQASDAGSATSETLHNMLQTNAPIASGDSGGPLANAAGQVIGMNTAANAQSLGGPGTSQGYSIPINRALALARLMAAGHASKAIQIGSPPFIGIAIASNPGNNATSSASSPQQQLRQLKAVARANQGFVNSSNGCLDSNAAAPVPTSIAPAKAGALIAGVFCHTPADAAGAQAGDVITAVNGTTVTSPTSLHTVIGKFRPGSTVSLTWVDTGGHRHTGSLKLAAGPAA